MRLHISCGQTCASRVLLTLPNLPCKIPCLLCRHFNPANGFSRIQLDAHSVVSFLIGSPQIRKPNAHCGMLIAHALPVLQSFSYAGRPNSSDPAGFSMRKCLPSESCTIATAAAKLSNTKPTRRLATHGSAYFTRFK